MCRSARAVALSIFLVTSACRRETAIQQPEPPLVHKGAPVIVISIDTLRADRLPAYGYTNGRTPAIDALRRDSILFSSAWSHCPMTLPSHVSILTGLLPYQNGVRNNVGYRFDGQKHDSLPMMLRRSGYGSAAAVSAYVLRADTGLGSLFDVYDDQVSGGANVGMGELSRAGAQTVEVADHWISDHGGVPFFYFLHLFEPHWPYEAPEPFRSQVADPYDAEVSAADAAVGEFISQLKASGVYDRAIVILLSDHGEGLGDHDEMEHGVFLYREAIHVPLLLKLPQGERGGSTLDAPVSLIDVMPTVAQLVGATPRGPLPGRSLLAAPERGRKIYSETLLPRIHFGWSELYSLLDGEHHYIQAPRSELYDMRDDPRETRSVASRERRVLSEMRAAMEERAAAFTAPAPVDREEAEKLAALGYIGQVRSEQDAGALPDPKDRIRDLEELKSGSARERRGEIAQAVATYRSIVRRNPRFADGWLRLAALQERMGELDDAAESYRNAVNASPVLIGDVAISIGSLFLKMGKLEDAAAHAELARQSSPGASHHLIGRIALARGDLTTAETEARAAMDQGLYHAPGAVLLARVWTRQGRLGEAVALLDGIRQSSSARSPVRDLESTRGDLLARLERVPEAESAFRAEIQHFPQNSEAYTRLALLYIATGRERDAATLLEQMFEHTPSRGTGLLAAGVWEAAGNKSAAAKWKSRAERAGR